MRSRIVLCILAVLAIGALLGLLAGGLVHFKQDWHWHWGRWAAGGAAFALVAVCMFLWWALDGGERLVALAAGVLLASVLAPTPARAADDGDELQVPIQVKCEDGRLVALRMLITEVGVLTLQIPPDVCKAAAAPQQSQQDRRPARADKGRST